MKGSAHQFRTHVVRKGPADNFARAQVDDNGQIHPATGRRNKGDVTGPDLVGLLRKGLVEQEIG